MPRNIGASTNPSCKHRAALTNPLLTVSRLQDTAIYDISWSPTGEYLMVGGTDKTVRIISTEGRVLREIAEHNHRVQGVAWDPMNEFLASQSSDRSVHIHSLTIKHGHIDTHAVSKNNKMQVRASRTPSRTRRHGSVVSDAESVAGDDIGDMPPPRSRRSSFSGSQAGGPASRGSSPAPPLPAIRTWTMYNDENANHYFRRLTFSPDGAMLLTPAGQVEDPAVVPGTKSPVTPDGGAQGTSSVFVYTRANFTRPPVAQLPGFKKATVAVRFSPVLYELRPHAGAEDQTPAEVTIDKDTDMEVDVDLSGAATASSSVIAPLPSPARETPPTVSAPPPVFALPYRMIYAVAAMDSIAVYDTQQAAPIAVLSRLHYDEFTDVSWSGDGRVLVLAARDGYCTAVVFDEKVTLHPTQQPALQLQSIAAHSFGGSHAAQVQQHQQQTPIMASPSPSVVAPSPAPSHSSLASISQSQSAPAVGSMKRAASPGVEMVPSSSDGMDIVSNNNGDGVPPKKKRRLVLTHHPEQ